MVKNRESITGGLRGAEMTDSQMGRMDWMQILTGTRVAEGRQGKEPGMKGRTDG